MAAHALLLCHLHDSFEEKDLALYLLCRGIPFHTLQNSEKMQLTPSVNNHEKLWKSRNHPVGHVFTLRDYPAYLDDCDTILHHRRSRAALLQGGYTWRVAISTVHLDNVLSGPSGSSMNEDEVFSVTLDNGKKYIDDALTDYEVTLLCGSYNCATGKHLSVVTFRLA